MKELSTEEKARRYDEAIEELRAMMPNWENLSYNGKTFLQDLVHIIPELKESEDEKIRKEIIGLVMQPTWKTEKEFHRRNELCVWLEKQRDQKPIVKTQMVYPKFRIGDVISPNVEDGKGDYTIVGFNKALADYLVDGGNIPSCSIGIEFIDANFHIKKQKPAEWSEEDEYIIEEIEAIIDAYVLEENNPKALIDWLKSLRPQNRWKPSDEQMHYLSWIANIKLGDSVVEQEVSKHLNELYEDLLKLREG